VIKGFSRFYQMEIWEFFKIKENWGALICPFELFCFKLYPWIALHTCLLFFMYGTQFSNSFVNWFMWRFFFQFLIIKRFFCFWILQTFAVWCFRDVNYQKFVIQDKICFQGQFGLCFYWMSHVAVDSNILHLTRFCIKLFLKLSLFESDSITLYWNVLM